MQQLDYLWRLIAKFLALAFIFVGGGFLGAFIVPLAMLIPGQKCERVQYLVQYSFKFYLWWLQKTKVIDVRVDHADRLQQKGHMIIANHPSLLDVVILMSLVPRVQCIVKHQLWKHMTLGILMRKAEYIRNDLSPEELIAQCKDATQKGRTLIIFPEGTRTPAGGIRKFNRGFANIALLTETPLLPVTITCNPPHLYKGEPWWHVPKRRPIFHVTVGESLDITPYIHYGSRSLAARKLVRAVEHHYEQMIDHV